MASQPICQIITPVGMLGYGFDQALTAHELTKLVPTGIPTAIILDSGSTDSGPEKLALGNTSCPESAYVRDLSSLLHLAHTFRVPLIFGSAGGDGTDEHVKLMGEIIREVAEDKNYNIKAISIFSGIQKSVILDRLNAGRISGCGSFVPSLTPADVDSCPRIVAQIGSEPYINAMEAHPDFNVIIGGRTNDPAPYAAYCAYQLKKQHPEMSPEHVQERYGGFLHMGKIMECGGFCSTPKSPGAVATIYPTGVFEIRPTSPSSRCTPVSVAAHALYENSRPDILRGPGGTLHLNETKYEQLEDGQSVRVSGSKYVSSKSDGLPYQLKLEGARVLGYRSMFMGSVKDHILIGQIDNLLPRVRAYVKEQHPDVPDGWELDFHIYGKGQSTPMGPGELFIICEVLASTQKIANMMASKARVAMIHGPYPGMKATAGNFAFGIGGKMEVELGPCAKFAVYHLMDLEPGEERLEFDQDNGASKNGLIRASIANLGKGESLESTEEFRASVKLLQETFPKPTAQGSTYVAKSQDQTPSGPPKTLSDLAHVLRSKNAGPFDITIDVMFASENAYSAVKESGLLSDESVAKALGIPADDIVWSGFFEPARSFKVTIPRVRAGKKTSAGGFMENDVHGSQQHLGLATLALPEALAQGLGALS